MNGKGSDRRPSEGVMADKDRRYQMVDRIDKVDLCDYGNVVRISHSIGTCRFRMFLLRKEAKRLRKLLKAALREA